MEKTSYRAILVLTPVVFHLGSWVVDFRSANALDQEAWMYLEAVSVTKAAC